MTIDFQDLSGQVQKLWEEQFIEAQSQKSEPQVLKIDIVF